MTGITCLRFRTIRQWEANEVYVIQDSFSYKKIYSAWDRRKKGNLAQDPVRFKMCAL